MKFIAVTLTFLFASISFVYSQESVEAGKTIFNSRCTSCHAIDRRVIGPALKDVHNRHDEKWIVNFVHSSQTVIKGGDAVAVKLFQEYNQTVMPDHKDLSQAQIKNIIAYIKDESLKEPKAPAAAYVPAFTKPYKDKNGIIDRIVYLNFDEAQKPLKFSDTTSWLIIAILILTLITFFYVMTYLNHILDNYTAKKNKTSEIIEEEIIEDQLNSVALKVEIDAAYAKEEDCLSAHK